MPTRRLNGLMCHFFMPARRRSHPPDDCAMIADGIPGGSGGFTVDVPLLVGQVRLGIREAERELRHLRTVRPTAEELVYHAVEWRRVQQTKHSRVRARGGSSAGVVAGGAKTERFAEANVDRTDGVVDELGRNERWEDEVPALDE